MGGTVSCDCQWYWQVAEPPEDWPAIIWQQQRELAELQHSQEELLQRLCTQLEGLQSTVAGHVERALESRHEQERILVGSGPASRGVGAAVAFLDQACSLAVTQNGGWSGHWQKGSNGVGSCKSS